MASLRPSEKAEFRQQIHLIRRRHNEISPKLDAEARVIIDEIVIALELLSQAPIWRNGNGGSFWGSLLRMPGAAPVIWLLVGLVFLGVLTGQVKLADLFQFLAG